MKLLPLPGYARALAALVPFLFATAVHAQSFQPVGQGRWVLVGGDAFIRGQNGEPGTGNAFAYQPVLPSTDFSPFNHTETFSLDVAAPDGTAAAHLQGSASQASSIGPEAIRYAGSVGVTSTTSGTPQLAAVSADGQSFFGLFFDVTTPVSVVLSLHADFVGQGGVDFNLLNSTAGTATFSERAFGEENGTGGIARQDVLLTLTPGSYDMTMRMGAHFQHADGSLNAGASAAAEFSLVATAIPEAQTWLILVTGLPLVGALGRRRWKGSFSSFARH